jgi:hypothetical protein
MKSSDFYYKNRPSSTLQPADRASTMSISQMFAAAAHHITTTSGALVAPKMGIF